MIYDFQPPIRYPGDGRIGGYGVSPAGGDTTVNNVTVQTFAPRDVVMQYTAPDGVFRRSNTRLVLRGRY